jgi:hypothetical protein
MAEHAGVARGPISSSLHDGQHMSSNRPGQRNTAGTLIAVAIALATGGSAIATTTVSKTIDTWVTSQFQVTTGTYAGQTPTVISPIGNGSEVYSHRYAQANGGASLNTGSGTTLSVDGSGQQVKILYQTGWLSTSADSWLRLTINNLVNAGGATITMNLQNDPTKSATKTVSANGVMEFQQSDFSPGYTWSSGMGQISLFINGVGAGGSATTFNLSDFQLVVPGPGAIAVLGMVGLTSRRRRTA